MSFPGSWTTCFFIGIFFCRYHLIIWFWFFDWATGFIFFFLLLNFVCIGIRIVKQLYPIFLWTIFLLFLWPRFSTPSGQFSILLPMFYISIARCQDATKHFFADRWFLCVSNRSLTKQNSLLIFVFFFPNSLFDLEDFDIEPFSFFFDKTTLKIKRLNSIYFYYN